MSPSLDLHAIAYAALHQGVVVSAGWAELHRGFAVAVPGTEQVVPTTSQSALVGVLTGYVEHHADELAGVHRVLDVAPEGSSTCIDVAEVYADLPSATAAARALHQRVVLDVATHRTVAVDPAPTPGATEPLPAPRTAPERPAAVRPRAA